MKGALEKVSNTPVDQLDIQDKIWARDLRELSYDIEDSIDIYVVSGKGDESAKLHGIKRFIDRSVGLFRKAMIRHGIAIEIKDIKSRVTEVHERRRRYDVDNGIDKPTTTIVDPRLIAQYTEAKELVGIDETRDELINLLIDGNEPNEVPLQQGKIVSVVGFGGLGKTTLAKAVYEKIRALFDCCAFVSVSRTPDFKKLFRGLLYDLGKNIHEETLDENQLINVLREFLKPKRYLIFIDDIWDISVWNVIKCALPDNDVGYIILTTRNADVAEKAGGSYQLKPLSEDNSRKLMYKRVFGVRNNENIEDTEKWPDEDLVEVSDRILKKCAGVPLAINTMASLLACKARNKKDWLEAYNSIGAGLENNLDMENMRMILSFSYYNMPSHLRTCLLYFSMFPEDYIIGKDHLIRMWIAEGFIQREKQGKSLFEVGESYFNELINRSMIQPMMYTSDDRVYGCRVHDMVLDLICSLSTVANFVTILSGMDHKSPPSTMRRLSLQNGKEDNTMTQAAKSFQQVRSLVVHRSATSLIPVLRSFQVLRVMDLQDCDLSHGYSLRYLGNLLHLRYLGLRNTHIVQLPEEIGNLQLLQILDIRNNELFCLPSTIFHLKHLMFLYTRTSTRIPNRIGILTSLEELSELLIDDSNMGILDELGHLTELRVLRIALRKWNNSLLECLRKLQKIQDLSIRACRGQTNIGGLDGWMAPPHICRLYIERAYWFSTLPAWMNASLVPGLSSLSIAVRELKQGDLDILGSLPALRSLNLEVDHEDLRIPGGPLVGMDTFPCLVWCVFEGFVGPVAFHHGAMPRLRRLYLGFSARGAIEITSSCGGLDLGLGNLPALQEVSVGLDCNGALEKEVKELEAALRHSIRIHPNHPRLYGVAYEVAVADDE